MVDRVSFGADVSLAIVARAAATAWATWAPRVADGLAQLWPQLERWVWELGEVALGPRRACRQLLVAGCVQCLIVGWQLLERRRRWRRKDGALTDALARASTREEWVRAAEALDASDGGREWRAAGGAGEKFLDARSMRAATKRLETRTSVHAAMYALRGGALLSRDAHGMAEPRLYERARAGGPVLVEKYLSAALRALDFVERSRDPSVPTDARLAFFNECRHAHGRTALLLSGGAGLGAYHLGVVDALVTAGLLPRVISGASAGSIVAATVCCRTQTELVAILRDMTDDDAEPDYQAGKSGRGAALFRLDFFRWRHHMGDEEEASNSGAWHRSINEAGSLMSGDHLADVIRSNVGGDLTFQEAFDRTARILNIPVREHDATGQTGRVKAAAPPRLLNYLTAPHVVVWSAARASCAVPGVFAPSPLLVRDKDGSLRFEDGDDDQGDDSDDNGTERRHRTVYVDGSMGADLPMETMRTLFNCTHFICSQTNLHAAVLGESALRLVGATAPGVRQPPGVFGRTLLSAPASLTRQTCDAAHAVLRFLKSQLKTWVREGTVLVTDLVRSTLCHSTASFDPLWWERAVPWQFAGWALAVMTQPYEGRPQDVTIVPYAGHLSPFATVERTLDNPGLRAPIADVITAARKNTWIEIPKIQAHTAVEFALEHAVQSLRLALYNDNARQPTGTGIGRTPSFYTSPSLLQLSGLNVVDPLVAVDANAKRTRTPSISKRRSLTLAAAAKEQHGKPPVPPIADVDGASSAQSSKGEKRRSVSTDDVFAAHQTNFVVKTSTMANFYYRSMPHRANSAEDFVRKPISAPSSPTALRPPPPTPRDPRDGDDDNAPPSSYIARRESSVSDAEANFF